MNRKAHRISALDVFLLVLLLLGFALFSGAQIIAVPEFDKTTASGSPAQEVVFTTPNDEYMSLSFLVPSGTNQSDPHVPLPTALIWGTGNTSSDTVALPLRSTWVPHLWEYKVRSVAKEKDLTAHMAACGGASFANLSQSNSALLTTETSAARGSTGDWQARTSRYGSSGRKFTGEPRPRNPIPLPLR